MTDEELEKLIDDMAEKYASEEANNILGDEWEEIVDSIKHAFIEGFKAGMKFQEERK